MMYGYDKKINSSAKLLRENNLDTLPLLSQTEYEQLFQCKLPIPTEDLDQLKNDLSEYGYCYLKNAMTDKQLKNLTQRIQEQAIAEVDNGVAHLEGGAQYGWGRKGKSNQRIFALHNKGKIFQDLATCDENVAQHGKIVWALLQDMLGRGFLLSAANSNFAGKGGQAMFLHQDQGYVPLPYPPYPLVCQTIWLLDDFKQETGGTILVPKSHKILNTSNNFQKKDKIISYAISATAPKGSCLIFDGRTLHGTGINKTKNPRRGVLFYYCRGWVRQQENIYLSFSKEARAMASPEFLMLSGYHPWRTLGQVEGEGAFRNAAFVDVVNNPVGPLYPLSKDIDKPDDANNLRSNNNTNDDSFSILKERGKFDFKKGRQSKL